MGISEGFQGASNASVVMLGAPATWQLMGLDETCVVHEFIHALGFATRDQQILCAVHVVLILFKKLKLISARIK